jgi:hypothetical protein
VVFLRYRLRSRKADGRGRRNWFLERVLKLGLTPLAKEYQCVSPILFSPPYRPDFGHIPQCSTCPDSANCARLLEEKWRQAYNAVFRFGQFPLSLLTDRLSLTLAMLLRSMPAIDRLSFPAYTRRRQSTIIFDPSRLSNNRQSFHSHS